MGWNGGLQWLLELALIVLLAATLFHALRLEKALGVLKRDRAQLEELVSGFNASTRQAEAGIERLHAAADGAGRLISKQVDAAGGLRDDMVFLIERGERLADRLDALVRAGRSIAPDTARAPLSELRHETRAELPRIEAAREAPRLEPRAEPRHADPRLDLVRPDLLRPDLLRPDLTRPELGRSDVLREPVRATVPRAEPARPESGRAELARMDAARLHSARQEIARQEAARAEARPQFWRDVAETAEASLPRHEPPERAEPARPPEPAGPQPRLRSQAERDLLKALKLGR